MANHLVREFASDDAVARVGEGLLARHLPREEWTHEAHLGATLYLALRHPEIDLERDLPNLIRRFNESVGGVNDDTQGYHETITQAFLKGLRLFLAEANPAEPIHDLANDLLHSPMGKRDWPLRFWSKERLFSVTSRRDYVAPDLGNIPPPPERRPPAAH